MPDSRESLDLESSRSSWTGADSSFRSSNASLGDSSREGGSYQCIATLTGHSGPVSSLAVAGNAIYSGGFDDSDIRIWSQPEMTRSSGVSAVREGPVKSLLVNGDHLFSAHQDGKILVWKLSSESLTDPKITASLPTFKDCFLRCFVPNNYVTVRRHKSKLWIQHNDAVSVLVKGPDNVIYSGSWDKTIKVWRTTDFKCLESIAGHDDAISGLATDRQGFLYSSSADSTLKVWRKDSKRHTLVATLNGHKSSVNAVAFSPDESVLYAASSDKTISVWERSVKQEDPHMGMTGRLKGHRLAVLCIATAGDILCSGSADKTVRVWRRMGSNYCVAAILDGHKGPVKCICVSTEAVEMGWMVYSGSIDKSVKVWWLAPMKDSPSNGNSSFGGNSPQRLQWKPSECTGSPEGRKFISSPFCIY